jgi:hypothetical protein
MNLEIVTVSVSFPAYPEFYPNALSCEKVGLIDTWADFQPKEIVHELAR